MFSVKHIAIDGSEQIHLAYEVRFVPAGPEMAIKQRSPIESAHTNGLVVLTKPVQNSGALGTYTHGLQGGTVFVMNDVGKTVSRYDLGASPVAHGVDPHTLFDPAATNTDDIGRKAA